MDRDMKLRYATRNNAVWCNTVCRAHGIPGRFDDHVWVNPNPVPRFYSNMTTLSEGKAAVTAQRAQVVSLLESGLVLPWSIKDGFHGVPLADLGFTVLFEASWIWCAPETKVVCGDDALCWSVVQDPEGLAAWEMFWGADEAHTGDESQPRLFVPSLLNEPDVVFFAGHTRVGVLAAVGIANRTGPVVGISNVFASSTKHDAPWWPSFVQAVQAHFPDLPLVGYERGDDLGAVVRLGFEAFHPLRVWLCEV